MVITMLDQIAKSFQSNDIYTMIMFGLLALGMLVFFERFIILQTYYNLNFKKFLNDFKKIIAADDNFRAMNLCKNTSKTSLPRITLKALEASETDPTTVRNTVEEETIDFIPKIERRVATLSAIALLVLMVGVLGTIDALWHAFNSIDILDSSQKQISLTRSVAQALNPTSLAVVIGIVILVCQQVIKSIACSLMNKIHHGATVVANQLAPSALVYAGGGAHSGSGGMKSPGAVSDLLMDDAQNEATLAQNDVEEELSDDEDFGDVTVDDIKDEEEII